MGPSRFCSAIVLFFFANAVVVTANAGIAASSNLKIEVQIITDEADAVLSILAKLKSQQTVSDSDWQHLFSSEGYVRLKKREAAMQRAFEDSDFKTFVLSDGLRERHQALSDTLAKWKTVDVKRIAQRVLTYLPKNAHIQAKIYPEIKPRENSFVFDVETDPAIFLYLDPKVGKEKFENTLAHELHHIGFGTACPSQQTKAAIAKLPQNQQNLLVWLGAFGEGFAMLAAAGGPNIHPHAVSLADERNRWDKDVAKFDSDLKLVENFFLGILGNKLTDEERTRTAREFYGVQGPWYTVGWKMAVTIEKVFGRARLIECMCDQRQLLSTYNKAATQVNRRGKEKLALWSDAVTSKITTNHHNP